MSKITLNKRILVLTENFPPISGGSGRWFWELYSRLPSDQITVVTNEHPNASAFDTAAKMQVIRIKLSSPEWGLKSFTGLRFYIQTVRRLRKVVKDNKIDEIHCGRVIHEGVSAWLLSLFSAVKFVCYVHGEDVETAATSGEHNLMVRQVCKAAKYLICNSHNSANIVKRLAYANDNKIRVLHPGVDAQKFKPAALDEAFREKMGWSDKFVILTVGRLQKRKGQDKMIEAMPLILKEHPNALYAVVGSGECKSELEHLISKLGLEKEVQLLSEISDTDMIACYQQCDLFILPNRTIDNDIEGFGMVLVEAQACGKAVIAGDSGGTKETMLVGSSGEIIDCSKPSAIAAGILNFKESGTKLIEYGAAGREQVLESLDWGAHVRKALTFFQGA